jgi:hypothetical protein
MKCVLCQVNWASHNELCCQCRAVVYRTPLHAPVPPTPVREPALVK